MNTSSFCAAGETYDGSGGLGNGFGEDGQLDAQVKLGVHRDRVGRSRYTGHLCWRGGDNGGGTADFRRDGDGLGREGLLVIMLLKTRDQGSFVPATKVTKMSAGMHAEKGGTDAGRPRLRASFLSSLTVSFSHAFVRSTVETKERVLRGATAGLSWAARAERSMAVWR